MRTLAAMLVLCASQVALAALPTGWFMTGRDPTKFEAQRQMNGWNGKPMVAMRLKQPGDTGWSSAASIVRADQYRGKRVRFTAMVKTDAVTGWAALWMRVDGQRDGHSLAFDNMQDRAIKGTTQWTQYQVVLDVAPEAEAIFFGFLMNDGGVAYFSAPTLDVVGKDIPTTGTGVGVAPMQPQLDLSK